MEDVHFEDHLKRGEMPLHESLRALTMAPPALLLSWLGRDGEFDRRAGQA